MKLDTIVAGVDFKGSGLSSARWVAKHFAPERIVLVHALDLPNPPRFLKDLWGDPEQLLHSARMGVTERIGRLAEQFERETGVKTEARDRVGSPPEQIAKVADALDAQLIVVGAQGRSKGPWNMLGSTAARLLHEARIPTLVGRGSMDEPPSEILAAIDETALEAGALSWTKELAVEFEATPTLLHVLEVPLAANLRAIKPAHRSSDPELEKIASDWLTDGVRDAELPEDTHVRVAIGEPSVEILAAAQRYDTDLIIVGTHGFGRLGQGLYGSVADSVIRGAPCPVLAVPTGEAKAGRHHAA